MVLVYNCNEDAAAAFISGLQIIHSFCKYLVKNDVTKMRDILVRAQKNMQIEEATRAATSHPPKQGPEVEKLKSQFFRGRIQTTTPPLFTNHPGMRSNLVREVKQSPASFYSGYLSTMSSTPSTTRLGSSVQADRSHRTRRDLGPEITAPSTMGGATSRRVVAPSDDTFRIWSIKDISGNSSLAYCPRRLVQKQPETIDEY